MASPVDRVLRGFVLCLGVIAGAFVASVLLAPSASADERPPLGGVVGRVVDAVPGPASPVVEDVIRPVATDVVAPVVKAAVAPVVEPVAKDVVAPVVKDAVAPVVEPVAAPVLNPVLDVVARVTDPVVDVAAPVTDPVLDAVAPVTDVVREATDPVSDAVARVTPPTDAPAPVADGGPATPSTETAAVLPTRGEDVRTTTADVLAPDPSLVRDTPAPFAPADPRGPLAPGAPTPGPSSSVGHGLLSTVDHDSLGPRATRHADTLSALGAGAHATLSTQAFHRPPVAPD